MLTEQRHKIILKELKQKEIIRVNDLVNLLHTSESTIRRDLTYLENINALKKIHGGATILKSRLIEPSYHEKQIQNIKGKRKIAKFAASCMEDGDCIYLDAGTSTFEMIQYIDKKSLIVVTNGLDHINAIIENNINGYILGGKVKNKTKAVIGSDALKSLERFRFDKCFLGINGIHLKYGFTTPDSEEAILKTNAINHSAQSYILADKSKFGEISFVKVGDLNQAFIITDCKMKNYEKYIQKTKVKVVTDQ